MESAHLMLWKNVRLRFYHSFITILEVIFPIIVFYQGLIFYQIFQDSQLVNVTRHSAMPEAELYKIFETAFVTLFYIPMNPFSNSIMKSVTSTIRVDEIFPLNNESILELKFSNDTFLARYHNLLPNRIVFAVVFTKSTSDSNRTFEYKIRAPTFQMSKNTRKFYSSFYTAPSDTEDEYIKSGFIGLQYALNKAFILFETGSPASDLPIMNVQRFPYTIYSNEQKYPEDIAYTLTLIGFIFLALTVPHYITIERHSGMKELMKTMGLPEWLLWFGWITYSLMIYPIVITAVTFILTSHLSGQAFYENISRLLLWIIFMLYCVANMSFLFAVGTLYNKHWVASIVTVIVWFLTSPGGLISLMLEDEDNYLIILLSVLLMCFIPNLVMYNAFKTLEYFEYKGSPTSLSAFLIDIVDPHIMHLKYILLLFITNIVLNSCVIFYMSSIYPGRYGRKKHILFIFSKIIPYFKKTNKFLADTDFTNADNEFVEKVPLSQIGFRIRQLQKKYGLFTTSTALNDLNLDICIGDITVLLGHNGAGKTTLLNILTGMTAETSGYVLYENTDITADRKKLINNIGYCAQHDVYFPYLTVKQHLLFFAMMKGNSEYRAQLLANELLNTLRMQDDNNKYVQELSAGTKRKLSLTLALIGYPKILILDEPTLGMDLMSRRRTWALLKKIKKNRIILITTQDMEEADMLGDRIAVMHGGHVFCYGSGIFLKTTFGTGYNLILSKEPGFITEQTTSLLHSVLPQATLQKDSDYFASYKLPIEQKFLFSRLFSVLEKHKSELNISDLEVSYSTMEQLFLNINTLATKDKGGTVLTSPVRDDTPLVKRQGWHLIYHQMVVLLNKRMKLISRRYIRTLLTIFLAIILGILNIKVIDWSYVVLYNSVYPPVKLTLDAYTNAEVVAFYEEEPTRYCQAYARYVRQNDGILINISHFDSQDGLLKFNKYNPYEYRDNLVAAAEFSSNKNTILYNTLMLHSPPIALNIYSNALLYGLRQNDDVSIIAVNHPISVNDVPTFCSTDLQRTYMTVCFWWIVIFSSATIAFFAYFIAFVITERVHGIQHLQTMSNLSGITYWIANFIFDYLYFASIVLVLVMAMKLSDSYGIFLFYDLAAWLIILLWFGISGILYSYVLGTFFDSIYIFLLVNIPINICCTVSLIVLQINDSYHQVTLDFISSVLPPFVLFNILSRYLFVLLNNNRCVYCMDWETPVCTEQTRHLDYFGHTAKHSSSMKLGKIMDLEIRRLMIYLTLNIFIYAFLLTISNSAFGNKLWNYMVNLILGSDSKYEGDEVFDMDQLVENEKREVSKFLEKNDHTKNKMAVIGLKKNFFYRYGKLSAIKDINFSVSSGQCFGIVGINGAGKSTTFKILSAYLAPTSGNVVIDNVDLKTQLKQYISLVGYCPQTNAIYEELTAREMLHLVATLRGLHDPLKHAEKWISILGIDHYQDKRIDTYSSGNKRKLCIALAMIGYPLAILLDEPTAGIDPSSRRKIYRAIKLAKRSDQIVVFASNSLKECEDICNRVSILQSGLVRRIGRVTQLKKLYASGYTIMVKLLNTNDYEKQVDLVIFQLISEYGESCQLKDKRLGLLQFVITDKNIPWSQLFASVEDLKKNHAVIEDYVVSNSTVDEAFLSSNIVVNLPSTSESVSRVLLKYPTT